MATDLADAYQRELDAVRRLAAEFAEAHPKIARRLRLTTNGVDDPHVERLLEGVAFLSARTQARLDDEFPELTDALLGILYPRYLSPVPSAAIVRFGCRPDLRAPVDVPAGTVLEADPLDGVVCRFRTTGEVRLWPIEVVSAELRGLPLAAPAIAVARRAKSCLRIRLRLGDPEARFDELAPATLRFFIAAPLVQAIRLYELLSQHTIGLALADGPNDDRPTPLPASSLQQAGFDADSALIPWPKRVFSGFRLLTEYFALPEKFLFVDIGGLDARTVVQASATLEIFVYFDMAMPELERALPPGCMALGCTPVVNLYHSACEPIRLDHWRTDYVVEPPRERQGSEEVWDVTQVREIEGDGSVRPWRPMYQRLADDPGDPAGMFTLIRRPSAQFRHGTETRLAPVDLELDPGRPADRVLSVDALLTNRDLPSRPAGGRRRAAAPPGGGAGRHRLDHLHGAAHAALAGADARAAQLAADLASRAGAAGAHRRGRRGRLAAGMAAPLRRAGIRHHAPRDREPAGGRRAREHGARAGHPDRQLLPRPRGDTPVRCGGPGIRAVSTS